MYKYSGARNVEAMEQFVVGGYKEAEGRVVPRRLTSLDKLEKEFKKAVRSLSALSRIDKVAGGLILATGVVVGLAIGYPLGTLFSSAPTQRVSVAADKKSK